MVRRRLKKQIRRNVFETNSSSVHAICMSNLASFEEQTAPSLDSLKGGVLIFQHGEYGWEFETRNTTLERASYLYEALFDVFSKDDLLKAEEHISAALEKYNIKCEFEEDNAGCWTDGEVIYKCSDGYVDHGGELKEFVFKLLTDDEMLIKYLFGDTLIITGNDNDEGVDYMYEKVESFQKDRYEVFLKGN